jgi:hypothetical protein
MAEWLINRKGFGRRWPWSNWGAIRCVLGGTEEKTSVRTAGVPAQIRTEHLPNTSVGRYRWANPLGNADVTGLFVATCCDPNNWVPTGRTKRGPSKLGRMKESEMQWQRRKWNNSEWREKNGNWEHENIKGANHIQSVPGGKINVLGGHSIGHSKQKIVYEHVSYPERFPW